MIKSNNFFKTIIELLLVIYFIFGGFENPGILRIEFIKYIGYVISIILQFVMLFYIFSNKNAKFNKRVLLLYTFNISTIVIIILRFLYLRVDFMIGLNRVLPLISIFGFIIIFGVHTSKLFDFEKVIRRTINGYFILGLIIILDALFFLITRQNFWPPVHYLGMRFSGPFYDSNFLGLFFGALFIITKHNLSINEKRKKLILIVFFINIFLSKSWTSIIFLLSAFLIRRFINFKNIFSKQLLMMFAYVLMIYLINHNLSYFREIFINVLMRINVFSEFELMAKFTSLEYRIVVQLEAISIWSTNLMGLGPRTVVPILGRDPHNSYIGFLFELGIPGIMLLLMNLKYKIKKNNKMLDILSTYIILMSFTLNVHYSAVFTLLIALLIKASYVVPILNNEENNKVFRQKTTNKFF